MKVRLRIVVVGLLLASIGLFMTWFWNNFDRVPVEKDLGYSREARANRLLAAERLLSELGMAATSLTRLSQPPPPGSVLFLPTSRRKLPTALSTQLKAWVAGGGHVLVVARAQEGGRVKDALLEGFGIYALEDDEATSDPNATVKIEIPGEKKTLRVHFDRRHGLKVEGDRLRTIAQEQGRVYAISRPIGRGLLTVLSDYRFAVNRNIGKFDHAAFLWRMISVHPTTETVWLIHGTDVPSLWERLKEQAWHALTAAAVLLVIWLWSASRRFGPLLAEPPAARRRLLEHIEASGRFLWRHRRAGELLGAVRESLRRSLEFRHPGWLAADDLHRRLAEMSGLPPASVKAALEQRDVRDEHQFIQTIRTLEIIRKQL